MQVIQNLKVPKSRGFTLIEIAVVMLIMTLLMSGLAPTITRQLDQQRTSETRRQLEEIRASLLGFAVANGRLPYPACGTLQANTTNAGLELSPASAAVCASASDIAVLPWATLGVSETDAWGRRFSYRVRSTFADATEGTTPSCPTSSGVSFQICSSGDANVKESSAGSSIASSLPVVIISHGNNGCGAYIPNGGNKIAISVGDSSGGDCNNAGNDQFENSDVTANTTFVSKTFSPNYDDLLVWITPNTLTSRMVAAGRLP